MRGLLGTAALAVLLVAGAASAAETRSVRAEAKLAKLDARELATTRARLEHRLLEVQRRRFEARNRGDADDVARMQRKFGSVNAGLRSVLVETRRPGQS